MTKIYFRWCVAVMETGWERNKRTHFNDIVADYDKIRPEYPREIFEDVIKYSNGSTGKLAIEIGA